jgi:hypothetical protein
MPSSGVYTFNPTVAEIIDDAFERCEKNPATLTARHIASARRSMNFMLAYWATKGVKTWTIAQNSFTTTQGIGTKTLTDGGIIAPMDVYLRRDNTDIPMEAISRDEYNRIHRKNYEGRPDRYFLDRQHPNPIMHLWQIPENSTDVVYYWMLKQVESVVGMSDTVDIPFFFQEAFTAGLAAKLSEKFAPEREEGFIAKAEYHLSEAIGASRERVDTTFTLPRRGRRRRR